MQYLDRPQRDVSRKMFVGGVPDGTTDEELKQVFESQSFKVTFVKSMAHKRIGFVEFESVEVLETALGGGPYNLNNCTLNCKKAGNKSGKQTFLYSFFIHICLRRWWPRRKLW